MSNIHTKKLKHTKNKTDICITHSKVFEYDSYMTQCAVVNINKIFYNLFIFK